MSDLKLDQLTNDLVVEDSDLQLVQLDEAIRQSLFQRLRLFFGEWFLDTSKGVPYYQNIFVKNPNLDVVQATLLNTIQGTPGIEEILNFEYTAYDPATRELGIAFQAKSTNGTIISVQTNIGGTTNV